MTSTQPFLRWSEHDPLSAGEAPRRAAFIGGEENLLVGRSLERLLQRPATAEGQLIVYYGPTGVGKSLLVEAVVGAWRSRCPQDKILALSAADFARRHNANNTPAQTRELADSLQNCDLFVLEDLDGLAGRDRPETELRLALDTLLARGATIIITAQAAPQKVEHLERGLASRLCGGLVVPVQLPAAPARAEILRVLALRQGLEFSPAALLKLAEVTSGNALRLNALLAELATALSAKNTRAGSPIELAAVEAFLQARQGSRQLDLRLLTRLVAKGFGLTTAELKSSSRKRPIVRARGIAMLLARRYSDHSLQSIGNHYGGRDHTTVLHACRKAEEELVAEPAFAQLTETIVAQLASITSATRSPA